MSNDYFGTPAKIDAARAKRRKEIQEYFRKDQDAADAYLLAVETPKKPYYEQDVSWGEEDDSAVEAEFIPAPPDTDIDWASDKTDDGLSDERIESIKTGIDEAHDGLTRSAEEVLNELETLEPAEEPVEPKKPAAKAPKSTSKGSTVAK